MDADVTLNMELRYLTQEKCQLYLAYHYTSTPISIARLPLFNQLIGSGWYLMATKEIPGSTTKMTQIRLTFQRVL